MTPEQRNAVMRGRPQHAGRVHQIAIVLEVRRTAGHTSGAPAPRPPQPAGAVSRRRAALRPGVYADNICRSSTADSRPMPPAQSSSLDLLPDLG